MDENAILRKTCTCSSSNDTYEFTSYDSSANFHEFNTILSHTKSNA